MSKKEITICDKCSWKKVGRYCEKWPKSKGDKWMPATKPYKGTIWCSEFKSKVILTN